MISRPIYIQQRCSCIYSLGYGYKIIIYANNDKFVFSFHFLHFLFIFIYFIGNGPHLKITHLSL